MLTTAKAVSRNWSRDIHQKQIQKSVLRVRVSIPKQGEGVSIITHWEEIAKFAWPRFRRTASPQRGIHTIENV